MEKALLKVTRFNNSDVIATSGDSICHDTHVKVTGPVETTATDYIFDCIQYRYNDGNIEIAEITDKNVEKSLFASEPVKGTTYGFGSNGWEPCTYSVELIK